MEKIKIENLTFTYPNRNTAALKNINLTVNQGEFAVICGKSGCGKSTLLQHLKPQLTPQGITNGAIYFNGKETTKLSAREQAEKIGFVMQNPSSQIVCDKVWHELAFGLENLGYPSSQIRSRVAEMASFFGIQNWYHKDVHQLSGGQKQLLNLAAVMALQPEILILDEPTSQLDPISAHDFLDTVYKINKDLGTTIILSEHRLEEALPICDRMIVMANGEITADGSVKEIGELLKKSGSDMFDALPTPMKVYYSKENDFDCPLTIGDGRKWLEKHHIRTDVHYKDTKESDTEIAISAKDIWFRYEKNSTDILKGLNLKIHQGEFYSIVGGNGVGKTTLLLTLMGIEKPYRGKISSNLKIASLPQNPQNLFVKSTVIKDLYDAFDGTDIPQNTADKKLREVISFCELEGLLESHPYDLSGGEQQKAALAKVLLKEPQILLLDEPTKGLDAHFKKKLAEKIRSLQKSGITIISVSHDIEFCAKYADRLGMMFDGEIVSEGTPREFFTANRFYTTAASRMARGVLPRAITDEDIINAVGGEVKEEIQFEINSHEVYAPNIAYSEKTDKKGKIPKRTLLSAISVLLLIPLTIFIGMTYFGDRRYYFISMMIILETMLPFAIIFEGRKPQAKEIVIISVLCAITVAGRIAFAPVPFFKPVLALIIISGICLGGETGFLVGALTAFISNFYFTHGPWTPWQMFVYGLIGFIAGILSQSGFLCKNKYAVCVFGFLSAIIIHGGILNPASVIMYQDNVTWDMIKSAMILGFPLDVNHGIATAFFLFLTFNPMMKKLERVKNKYGI